MTKQKKAHRLIARYRVALPARYVEMLEWTDDPVRIRGTKYRRAMLRGVPGRYCDVIIAESVLAHRADDAVVLDVTEHRPQKLPPALTDIVFEIGEKAGKYDGALRRRYALRQFTDASQRDAIPWADVRIVDVPPDGDETPAGAVTIIVRPRGGEANAVVDTFPRLKSNLLDYDIERIFTWHWRRWYTHLDSDWQTVEAARTAWAKANRERAASIWTLAEANRAAARDLYRLSRQLGWRKLTAEEKARLFLPAESPMWQRIESLLPRYAALAGNPLGVGEATLAAAHGDGSHWSEPLEYETEE